MRVVTLSARKDYLYTVLTSEVRQNRLLVLILRLAVQRGADGAHVAADVEERTGGVVLVLVGRVPRGGGVVKVAVGHFFCLGLGGCG